MTGNDTKGRIGTGCEGLDQILGGGLPRDRLYLLEGDPGSGKTTLGLQFLREGVRAGERCLYVSLSESPEEVREIAASHGWKLDGIQMHELPNLRDAEPDAHGTLFHPAEVELNEIVQNIVDAALRVKPQRVVFDSLSELRLLATNPLRYRRQILSLKQMFAKERTTVLLLDDRTSTTTDDTQSISHGVIELSQVAPVYGADRRQVRVRKMRGVAFTGGYHDLRIATGGVVVFPRLRAAEHAKNFPHQTIPSGIANLDAMLGGGLDRGTSALLIGPAGAGKSALATQYAITAATRGENTAVFVFDEGLDTVHARARALGTDLRPLVEKGKITLHRVDPTDLPPGELIAKVRDAVEKNESRVVVIDSVTGYLNSMPEERFMLIHLHEMLTYLRNRGVVCILIVAQHGLVGNMAAPVDISYLADTVLVLRFFETRGEVRKAISVLKRRSGPHETAIRELKMTAKGLTLGEALCDFEGVLTGTPKLERA